MKNSENSFNLYKILSLSLIINVVNLKLTNEKHMDNYENFDLKETFAFYKKNNKIHEQLENPLVAKFKTINEIPFKEVDNHLVQSFPPSSYNFSTTKGLDLDFSSPGDVLDSFLKQISAIYPGTVWCGMGNLAPTDASVGVFYATDNCCRLHDKCPDSIPPKEKRHGLSNTGIFTRSHCDCDREFYYCLKKTNTFISRKIGRTYFNVLKPQCFREEYPVIYCIKWEDKRCFLYIIDESRKPIWQWFDNKRF